MWSELCVIWVVCDLSYCTSVMKEDQIQWHFLVPFVMIRMFSMMKMDMFCDEKTFQWQTRGAIWNDPHGRASEGHVADATSSASVADATSSTTWQMPRHLPEWSTPRHLPPSTRHVTCHVICQRVTPSHVSRRHGPRHVAFPLVTNLAMSCDVYTFVTEDHLFHDKGRFVIEKFTSMMNLPISSRWDKCDGICMTNEFLSLIRHKTFSVTFWWPTMTKMNRHLCEIPY